METSNVWLDCDPGHDDAMAMILAYYNEKTTLIGVSSVFGNQSIKLTTLNALKIHYISGFSKDVIIAQGAEKALLRPKRSCPEIHGVEGLDTHSKELGELFPSHEALWKYGNEQKIYQKGKAVEVMAKTFLARKEVTLVCTGALTNVALLLSMYPEVTSHIKEIVSMGGSMGMGNTSPLAEWNIEIDPEAAKVVYGSGIRFTQVPLNVTHTALVTEEILDRIHALQTPFSALICDLLLFFKKTYTEIFDFADPPLHDPLAVAFVICPKMFKTKFMNVEIETNSTYCDGSTVCDFFGTTGRPKNVTVCLEVDIPAFWDMMIDAITKANENSPLNQ